MLDSIVSSLFGSWGERMMFRLFGSNCPECLAGRMQRGKGSDGIYRFCGYCGHISDVSPSACRCR